MRSMLFVTVLLAAATGCQTVHAEEDRMPVAFWTSTMIERPQERAEPRAPDTRDKVAAVLRDKGLHATVDHRGIFVPQDEHARAREVLLMDKRLVNSDVFVLLAVPAGTGRAVEGGFQIPTLSPHP
jgi:hypothetical protein